MEQYLSAKRIVDKRFSKEDSFYSLYVLALFGLLQKYPNDRKAIHDLFQRLDIFIEDESIPDIMRNHDMDVSLFFEEDEVNSNFCATYGLSSRGDSLEFDEDGEVSKVEEKPFIICSSKDCSPTDLLHIFVHEFNHLIKSYHNGFGIEKRKDFSGYFIRSGINIYRCYYKKNEDMLYEEDYFSTMDEVLNVLQTTDIVTYVLLLDGIVPDPEIQKKIDSLDKEALLQDFGYNSGVQLIRPLWKNDFFQSLVEANIVTGNIAEIIDGFDFLLEPKAFEKLCDALDELDELESKGQKGTRLLQVKKYISSIVDRYNKQTQKVYEK